MDPSKVHPSDYHYELPEERIAKFPLNDRSASKLLVYRNGSIKHFTFKDIPEQLREDNLLVFNNTKVISARIIFQKKTGAFIEVFLLNPESPSNLMEQAMQTKGACEWSCLIGNAKRWKEGKLEVKINDKYQLSAERIGSDRVRFNWNPEITFSEILDMAGQVPLPPYLNRKPTEQDKPRYQTVYSKIEGAVAAPTAGLHFTSEILDTLKDKLKLAEVTLHVSAGTFQPITTSVKDHPMHREFISVTRKTVIDLLENPNVIAVGTTSLRTLESLYWYGTKVLQGDEKFFIEKLTDNDIKIDRDESLRGVLAYMEKNHLESITGYTEMFIYPGYQFRIIKGLVTNFHLPGTTLLMLIAAWIGEDWEKVYQEALNNDYRFLSYGDSSLLIP
jgi:S-adenosylmethionine:tRNA ribosyltransferase-isomerase